ncbi:MAG: MerR family transcriptional regulator [Caulobacteraceae bacterium]|nr:MerR family transcriptional regulator [Caulobacteraceae bacterium]
MQKGPDAFRTISEAADELGVPQHVLRFWETKFSFIRPMKRAGGRRFYRPHDLTVLAGVRDLLHKEGFTIKGVQKLYRDQGSKRLVAGADGPVPELVPESAPEMAAQAVPVVAAAVPAPKSALPLTGFAALDAKARADLERNLKLLIDTKQRLDRVLDAQSL